MPLDLRKDTSEEKKYYYSEDGNPIGPFSLSELLEKIGPETLVYREGIDWTNAKEVQELKKFFKPKKVESDPISSFLTQEAVIPTPKPGSLASKKEVSAPTSSVLTQDRVIPTSNQASIPSEQKKMFSAPFSFKGRIRRMEYGLSIIIYSISYGIVMAMIENFSFVALAIIPLIWFMLAQGAKRCHDRGNSGWFQIIPFYSLWMLFAEGDQQANSYGNPVK
jgi:uncharacterized membrane protein YhaH (DUF805 family)